MYELLFLKCAIYPIKNVVARKGCAVSHEKKKKEKKLPYWICSTKIESGENAESSNRFVCFNHVITECNSCD